MGFLLPKWRVILGENSFLARMFKAGKQQTTNYNAIKQAFVDK